MNGTSMYVASEASEHVAHVIARHFCIEPEFIHAMGDSEAEIEAMNRSPTGWLGWIKVNWEQYPTLVEVWSLVTQTSVLNYEKFTDIFPVLHAIRDELGVDIAVADEDHPAPTALLAFRGSGVIENEFDDCRDDEDEAYWDMPPEPVNSADGGGGVA